jgi:predicted patatin/cPLA2 family phospholipase
MKISNSVHSLLMERARTNSKRGNRADKFHLALVIECGGMRGIAAGGFIKELTKLQLLDCFDTLHGSSAGACAAAYFLAQQPNQGIRIYYDDICTRRVVNPYRFWSQPCMVDTDYIVDQVIGRKRRLNFDKIILEPDVLKIVTTSIVDGRPAVHTNFKTEAQILRALKATLRIPGPFEPGIEIDGQNHLDGGMVAPIPVFSAIESGATHILTICTQRIQDYTVASKSLFFQSLVFGLLYGKQLRQSYLIAQSSDRRSLKSDRSIELEILVRPAGSNYCGWFTIKKDILRNIEAESAKVARAYFREFSP